MEDISYECAEKFAPRTVLPESVRKAGEEMQTAVLVKIANKLDSGKPLTGFEKSLWKVETGLVDEMPSDWGEEKVIKS